MTVLDLIIFGVLAYFIVSRFSDSPLNPKKNKSGKTSAKVFDVKVIKNKKESQEQLEKILKQAKVNSQIDKEKQLKEKAVNVEGLEKVKVYDESFTEGKFLDGAKKAYTWFYDCLNKDNESDLEKLVSPKIYNEIIKQLDDLDEKGEHKVTNIVNLEDPIIVDCTTHAKTAFINVKYKAKLEILIIDDETQNEVSKKTEQQEIVWTWARNVVSTDPNWQLDEIKNVS